MEAFRRTLHRLDYTKKQLYGALGGLQQFKELPEKPVLPPGVMFRRHAVKRGVMERYSLSVRDENLLPFGVQSATLFYSRDPAKNGSAGSAIHLVFKTPIDLARTVEGISKEHDYFAYPHKIGKIGDSIDSSSPVPIQFVMKSSELKESVFGHGGVNIVQNKAYLGPDLVRVMNSKALKSIHIAAKMPYLGGAVITSRRIVSEDPELITALLKHVKLIPKAKMH